MKTLAIILAISAPLLAQRNVSFSDKAQNQVVFRDVSQIVRWSVAATERSWAGRERYLYTERDEERRLDPGGGVKSKDVDVSKIEFVDGARFERLVERNGQSPSAGERKKEADQLNQMKRETRQKRAARLQEQQENRSFIREVPDAFDFQVIGEQVVNSRPAYVLRATPHAGYNAHGKYGKLMSGVVGTLWVDKQDFGWVKVEGEVIQPLTMGLFLARVLRGSHITMEQTQLDVGIWMPKRIEVRASAQVFFLKTYEINKILTYSDYQLLETESLASGPIQRRPTESAQ
jgi:hypothetical protein